MTRKPSHRDALRRAFEAIRAAGVPALADRGHTQSAGWADISDACRERGIDPVVGIFWHGQSDSAFDHHGLLSYDLTLNWAGDLDLYLRELSAQGLDVVRPQNDSEAIIVRATPLPGMHRFTAGPITESYPTEVAAIRLAPEEPGPRQALLAAMQAASDDRARFLELQIEYWVKGKLPRKKSKELYHCHRRHLVDFCGAIASWASPGAFYAEAGTPLVEYRRVDFAPKLRWGFPYSTTVRGRMDEVPDFNAPDWATVTELSISGADHVAAMLASPVPGRLRALSIHEAALTPMQAGRFSRVAKLVIDAPLAGSVWGFPALEQLGFTNADGDHEALLAMVPEGLEAVRVGPLTYQIEAGAPTAVRTAGDWPALTTRERAVRKALAGIPSGVRRLEVGCSIPDEDDQRLAMATLRDVLTDLRPDIEVVVQLDLAIERLRGPLQGGEKAAARREVDGLLEEGFTARELWVALQRLESDPGMSPAARRLCTRLGAAMEKLSKAEPPTLR